MHNFILSCLANGKAPPSHSHSMGVGLGQEVFINPLPLALQGFRTNNTTPSSALSFSNHFVCSLFQFQPRQLLSERNREQRAIATRIRMMMDRQLVVRQCDMEVMKMAMLKHEETFRQQVHELHRLYRIQRELMSDLTGRDDAAPMQLMTTTRRRSSKQPRRALNLQLPADEYIVSADEDEDEDAAAAAGAELELTLAIGGRCSRSAAGRRKNNNRRRKAAEQRDNGGSSTFGSDCSGASVLSSSPPSSAEYYSDDGPAPAPAFHALPPPPPPPCQRAMAFDIGEGMMMRQHAPWLLQCQQYLSLRMT